jgi:hypothetical protein
MDLNKIFDNNTIEDQELKPNIHKERDLNL